MSCGSFGQGLLMGLSNYGSSTYGYGGGYGSYDYLLDPNYAIAQTYAQQNYFNSVGNSIAKMSISQVENEEEEEYLQFKKYNKKNDGSDYSKSEWRAMKGEAIKNIKNSDCSENRNISNSGNLESKRCKKLMASDNTHCNGSGKCSRCNGKGRYFDSSYGYSGWIDPCQYCKGTGKCPSCNGTGYIK